MRLNLHISSPARRFGRSAGIGLLLWILAFAAAVPAVAGVAEAPGGGILFTYEDPYATQVFLAGDFNGWNATANPMTKGTDGVWSVVMNLPEGDHEYKFVVGGQWIADPSNPVTVGDFGNSAVRVGAGGKLEQMKATSNTELSPKIFLGTRYIVLMKERKTQGANPAWNLDRPDFDIDLDFDIRVNEQLTAHVLTNINNINQNVQLWETNLVFDRGSLLLQNEDINLMAFDNDSVGTWQDPLHLIGDVGIYHHAWGYDQQGVTAWRNFGKFEGTFLYSDNFRTGGTTSPTVDPLVLEPGGRVAADPSLSQAESYDYSFQDSDNDKDVLGLRLKGPILGENLTAGLSYRLDRGLNPGALARVVSDEEMEDGTRTLIVNSYPGTVESWNAGGADLHYFSDPAGVELYGEFLAGRNWISSGQGTRKRVTVTNIDSEQGTADQTVEDTGSAEAVDVTLNTSKRFKLGGHYFAYRGWHWKGSLEFQDADIKPDNGIGAGRYNRVTTYRVSAMFNGDEWKRWPWEAGLGLTVYDFSYGDHNRWTDQFWFDTSNFWLEQGEHLVTVDRLVMLGGNNVVSWRPHARWMFYAPRNATVEYNGIYNTTKIGRKPKYWENRFAFHVDITRRLGFNTDSRIVRYDDPVLDLAETFDSHFLELKYMFAPEIEVGLSWGVDPYVIDAPSNEYRYIGRDQFLFDRGANGSTAQTRFLDLSSTIRAAEQALEDEKVIQLEAILKF